MLQTPDYARALFMAWRSAGTEEELDQLVSVRIERQSVFECPKPPSLWAVIDEGVLTRCIGSAQTMHGQLEHLLHVSDRYQITVQVVPVAAGAHVGLLGASAIAAFENTPVSST